MKTWNYLAPDETQEIIDEWVWERLRLRRNLLLGASDSKMLSDAPWDLEPWKVYRQALRDLPSKVKDPRNVAWPVSPDGLSVPAYVEPIAVEEPVIEDEKIVYDYYEEVIEDESAPE